MCMALPFIPVVPICVGIACLAVLAWAFWWGKAMPHAAVTGVVAAPLAFAISLVLTPALLFSVSDLDSAVRIGLFFGVFMGVAGGLLAVLVGPVAAMLGLAASRLLFPVGKARAENESLDEVAQRVGCSHGYTRPAWTVAVCFLIFAL